MNINRQFDYPTLERVTNADGTRFYTDPTSGQPLPSVTTVLSGTADKSGIKAWEAWIGAEKAAQVKKEATDLGSLMHLNIENFVEGVERPRGNNLMRVLARRMADKIIENGLCHVDEIWGQEVGMYLPGLYAGTTDLVGIHKGAPAIMDHKSAKKLRTRDMIEDYMCQMAAYAVAHNEVYGTDIRKGVIFMVDRQLNYQEFILEGAEFDSYVTIFFNRVQTYLETQVAA
jgi:genome maintenance exonuclease 1